MLRINALGSLAIVRDSGPVTRAAAQPRRLAVLALLARAGQRGMTRDKIVSLLWPDADDERGRTTLSKVLYSVRRDLGDENVVIGANDLRLNPDVVTSDLAEFEQSIADGELERAAAVYQGPFLDGFRLPGAPEFDRWADAERATLRHDYGVVLEKLAKRKAEAGDLASAVRWWRTLAAHDPLNARHALGLMRALDESGDRTGAIQHARIYETLVQQELDLPADREVAAFARHLRDSPLAVSTRNRQSATASEVRAPSPAVSAVVAQPLAVAEVATSDPTSAAASRSDEPNSREDARATPSDAAGVARPRRLLTRSLIALSSGLAVLSVVLLADRFRLRSGPVDLRPVVALGRITDYRQPVESELARPLTDMLATSLGRLSGARVVSTARMYELLSQGSAAGDTSPAALVSAARRAGATELVDGALYSLDGGRLRLDLRRVDLASGSMRSTHSVIGASLIELADSGTARLASDLRAALPPGSIGDVTTQSVAAYRLYEQGLRAYYRRDVRTAEGLFEAALAEDSTFAMAAYYSALSAQSDRSRMVARLARAARLAGRATDRERLTILAHLAFLRDDPSLRALAETLVVRYPHEVDGYFFAGYALVNAGDFLAAPPLLNRAVAMDSLALGGERARCVACEALQALVAAYQAADSLGAAEREARRWLRLQPRSAAAWRSLSDVLAFEGRPADAMAARRAEAQIDPPSVLRDLSDIATHWINSGDYDRAEQVLLERLKGVVPAEESSAHWYLAITYRQQGRLAEALGHARRYRLTIGGGAPPNAAPKSALLEAQVLLEMGRFRESAALFDSVARWRSTEEVPAFLARYSAWAMTHAANALAALGDTAGLLARADSVRVLGEQSLFGRDRRLHHHVRGLLLAARGRDDDAIAELRRAIHSPNLGYTRTNYELARVLLRDDRPRDAIATLRSALRGPIEASSLYITRTELHELLAQAWETLGPGVRDSAAVHWAEVARAWKRADPAIVPRVRRADARLAALAR